jgi:hypothetical protein
MIATADVPVIEAKSTPDTMHRTIHARPDCISLPPEQLVRG